MKFEKLEAIRGFASLYVVLYHLLMKTTLTAFGVDLLLPFRFGQEAVILFFLLSGFVIQYSFEGSRDKSFKSYFFKRFTRIYIPLMFVFFLSYLLRDIEAGKILDVNLPNLLGNIFMLQDINVKPHVVTGTYMGNSPLWSLSYEWWFYMIFYLLYKFIKSRRLHIVVGIVVLISGCTYVFYPFFINRIIFYFGIWWIGVELASLYRSNGNIELRKLGYSYFLLSSLVLICMLNCIINFKKYHSSFGASPVLELRHFSFALIVLSLALLWQRFKWIGFDSLFGIFVKIAPISYTIYIAHWPLLISTGYLEFIHNLVIKISVALLLLLFFCYIIEMIVYPSLRNLLYSIIYKQKLAKA